MFSSEEIQKRIQSGYIERIRTRLRRMRKLLTESDWITLRAETTQLLEGAQNFGYKDLAAEVQETLDILNRLTLTRTAIDPEAKITLELLFRRLDRFLVEEHRF